MFPRSRQQREEWLESRTAKFQQDIFFKAVYLNSFFKEAEQTYLEGYFNASILCTSVALNHFLFNMVKPQLDNKGRAPPTRKMITIAFRQGKISEKKLVNRLQFFQENIRDQFEHKKSVIGTSRGMFELLEEEDSQLFDEAEARGEESDIIYPYVAYKALEYYYCVCDYYYDYLVIVNEHIAEIRYIFKEIEDWPLAISSIEKQALGKGMTTKDFKKAIEEMKQRGLIIESQQGWIERKRLR